MLKIDLQSRIPIYEQLKNQIIMLSMLGALGENERLPSVRTLAREIGINPNTVQKAYQELERDGMIYTVTGKGSFIASNEQTKSQIQKKALSDVTQTAKRAFSSGCDESSVLAAAKAGNTNSQAGRNE